VNLRYETPWFNELLLANLLAPPGAGSLSQYVSQQEYSRLLQHDGVGGMVGTEYLSTGDWMQSGSVYGSFGKTDFSLDGIYDSFKGDRPNDGVEQHAIYAKIREQITARDTLFLQLIQYHNNSGDTLDHYDPPAPARRFVLARIRSLTSIWDGIGNGRPGATRSSWRRVWKTRRRWGTHRPFSPCYN